MTPRRSPALAAVLTALSVFLWLKVFAVKLFDPDLWWHLAAGRWMAVHRAVLSHDVFSHTFAGAPWINFEWLGQLGLYAVYALGGPWALWVLKIAISFSAVGWLVLVARRAGARGPGLYGLAWLSFLILQPRLFEKLEVVSWNFMGLLVLALVAARDDAAVRRGLPFFTGLLIALWTNVHGAFVYGVAAVLLVGIGARWAGAGPAVVAAYDRTFTAALIGMMLNPYGPRISEIYLEHLLQVGGGAGLIQEWRPPTVKALPFFWATFVAAGGCLVAGVWRRDTEARFWAPLFVVFAAWGGTLYRNAPLIAFAAIPFLAAAGAHVLRRVPAARLSKLVMAGWLLAWGPLVAWAHYASRPWPDAPVHKTRFPVDAAEFVKKNGIAGPLYNTYEFGGYLVWVFDGNPAVFMDGRYLFYPFLQEEITILKGLSRGPDVNGWPGYFRRHQVAAAVVDYSKQTFRYSTMPFALSVLNLQFSRDEWALVYWDDAALVFLRRGAGNDAVIAAHEYKVLRPFNIEQMKFLLAHGTVDAGQVRAELDRHAREQGFSVRAHEIEMALKDSAALRALVPPAAAPR